MKNIYFLGINGIGMSGLAKIMKEKNYNVEGTDPNHNLICDELEKIGIKVNNQHKEENLKNFDTVIVSSAISPENPEIKYARKNKLKILKRGELLANLLNDHTGIGISGTHGKTTTTSMLASVMLTKDPTVVVGGILPEIGSNSRTGKSDYFIAEADESDQSFLYMYPKYSIITNIEEDHMENYGTLDAIKAAFLKFIKKTEIKSIVCIDNKNVADVVKDLKRDEIVTYGITNKEAMITADNIKYENDKITYDVFFKNKSLGNYELSIPGMHNVLNSLPVIYLASILGVENEIIFNALKNFKGTKRRYDVLLNDINSGIKIIDDYAHHPTEIMATLAGAKAREKYPITVIFQPHRYSRTKLLLEKFKNCFDIAQNLVLMPIYSAGESNNEFGITIEDLKDKTLHKNVKIEKNKDNIEKMVKNSNGEEIFIFMGAGDISKLANEIAISMKNNI